MEKGFDEGIVLKKGYESPIDCLEIDVSQKGKVSSTHYHDYIELLYGVDCDITLWVNDNTLHFETGDLIIINPHETHALYSNKASGSYIVIKFMPGILQHDKQMPPEIMYMFPFMQGSPYSEHIIKKDSTYHDLLSETIFEIYNEWCEERFGYELAIRSGILRLFVHIVRYWNKNNTYNLLSEKDEMTMLIYKAAEYCSENYTDVTASQLAEKYSISYSYFSRMFKKIIGCSFTEYLNDIRINNAIKLLLTSSKSMTEISERTGFSSSSHFIHNFRKKTGMPPLVYKKNFKEKYQ